MGELHKDILENSTSESKIEELNELKIKYSILEDEFLEKSSIIENMKQTQTIGDIPGTIVKKITTQSNT